MRAASRPQPRDILACVRESVREVLTSTQRKATLRPETKLIGRSGLLDSLGLVRVIVLVEQRIREEFQSSIVLADERALSQTSSPFRTVQSLADYVWALIQEGSRE
jgi:acyl carrier protein